jgi:hypothetical protein
MAAIVVDVQFWEHREGKYVGEYSFNEAGELGATPNLLRVSEQRPLWMEILSTVQLYHWLNNRTR